MKNLIKILTACAALAAVAAPPAFANDPMSESLRSISGAQFDQAFLTQMRDHHKQGLEMAQLALRKSQSPAVKSFAEKTSRMQQKDIGEITALLGVGNSSGASSPKSVHGDGHEAGTSTNGGMAPSMSHEMQGTAHQQMKQATMSKLEGAEGANFDSAFTSEMLKHHQAAKEMAQLAQKKSSREDVKAFAAKTVSMQEKEAKELEQLSGES